MNLVTYQRERGHEERERERDQWVFLLSAGRNSVPAAFLILVQQRPSASQALPQIAATLRYNLIYTTLYDLSARVTESETEFVCVRKEERAPVKLNEKQTEFMKLINYTGSEQCSLLGLPFLQCSLQNSNSTGHPLTFTGCSCVCGTGQVCWKLNIILDALSCASKAVVCTRLLK